MLVARDALTLIRTELDGVAAAAAELAAAHRSTIMAGRTLLQQALPVTFGLKAAGWLVAVLDARRLLADQRLTVQLGGAAGTLAALGDAGPQSARRARAGARARGARAALAHRARADRRAGGRARRRGGCARQGGGRHRAAGADRGRRGHRGVRRRLVGDAPQAEPRRRHPHAGPARSRPSPPRRRCSRRRATRHERAAGAWQAEWLPLRYRARIHRRRRGGAAPVAGGPAGAPGADAREPRPRAGRRAAGARRRAGVRGSVRRSCAGALPEEVT
jgi:3-carboxy-cis,cis-muconate cycloisomerase